MKEEHVDMPIVAAVKEKPKHESRVRMDQAVQREVREAMERKEYEIAQALADAGVPINRFPNTPEGAKALQLSMQLMDVTVMKIGFSDNGPRSGYYIMRCGREVGFVPCEVVRGVLI